MIKAEIGFDNGVYLARIEGHANYAPKGQDIVCAGVSALAGALLESLVGLLNDENNSFIKTSVNDGFFEVTVGRPKNQKTELMVRELFYMLMTGLTRIERDYPAYIELSTFDIPERVVDNDTSEQTMNEKREEVRG